MFELFREILGYFESNVILMGLSAFLGAIAVKRIETKESAKLRQLIDSKLSLLVAKNEPVIHVNREQAEFEFSRYREMWEATSEISALMSSAVKRVGDLEKLKITFQTLHEVRCTLGALTNNAYPFIDNEVYENALACHKSSHDFMQLLTYAENLKPSDELANINKREFDMVLVHYDTQSRQLALAIKGRLEVMSVLQTQA
ncbi:hypothetical protein L3I77_004826 [Vibrio vulnificus]|nr:hypothetical protein [Vibrio vulnificus]EIU7554825.1 hypothetical protein [Vibrio vulnificus]